MPQFMEYTACLISMRMHSVDRILHVIRAVSDDSLWRKQKQPYRMVALFSRYFLRTSYFVPRKNTNQLSVTKTSRL